MTNCGRCYSLRGKVRKGWIKVVGPQGIVDHVCQECYDEIENEQSILYLTNEDEEN